MYLTITPNVCSQPRAKKISTQKYQSVNFGNGVYPVRLLTCEEQASFNKIAKASQSGFKEVKNLIVKELFDEYRKLIGYSLKVPSKPDMTAYCHTSAAANPYLVVNQGKECYFLQPSGLMPFNNVSNGANPEFVSASLKSIADAI